MSGTAKPLMERATSAAIAARARARGDKDARAELVPKLTWLAGYEAGRRSMRDAPKRQRTVLFPK